MADEFYDGMTHDEILSEHAIVASRWFGDEVI